MMRRADRLDAAQSKSADRSAGAFIVAFGEGDQATI
jgi:hypothetical protein